MMADWDVLAAVPTRGRPAGLRRLIAALAGRSATRVLLAVGLDEDDPALGDYLDLLYPPHDEDLLPIVRDALIEVAPRMTLAGWTNRLVATNDGRAQFVASLGDDHEPITWGWDRMLIAGVASLFGGIGIAYGNDTLQGEALPTAPLMNAEIPAALGYMCPPVLDHSYVDNAWRDLGHGAGALIYCPDVIIRHHHPHGPTGGGRAGFLWDQTYEDAQQPGALTRDLISYRAWQDGGLADGVEAIRGLAVNGYDPR